MDRHGNQFQILLVKNFKMIFRNPTLWMMSLFLPICIASSLIVVRHFVVEEYVDEVREYPDLAVNNFWDIK